MSTIISKINAFQIEFQEFMQRKVKEIGMGEEILNKIVLEDITKVKSVTQFETMLIASASKARAASPHGVGGGSSSKLAAAAVPQQKPKPSAAASAPTLTISSYKEAVKSPFSSVQITESWGDLAIATAPKGAAAAPITAAAAAPTTAAAAAPTTAAAAAAAAPSEATLPWMVEAEKEFTSFTKITSKKTPNTYFFYRRSVPEILKSLNNSRTKKHPEDTLMEWIHNLPLEKVGPWLEDVTTRADFRNESCPFTIATIIYAFIPFFIKHNLTKNMLTHVGYCTSLVVIPEPSTSEESCAMYFGLSPEDKPTDGMLREVALIQVIQNYVLSHIKTLLESKKAVYKIRSIETDASGDIKISFSSEEATEKFSMAMKYDMRKDGYL